MERRFWYGIGILAIFLGLGLWAAWGMETMHRPVSAGLDQAVRAALEDRMPEAIGLLEQAETAWQQHRGLTAALADHAPMEEIDSLFSQTRIYGKSGNQTEFAAYCGRIARLVEALGEAHGLNWQNLL